MSVGGKGLVAAITMAITVVITLLEGEGGDGCAKNMLNLLQ